MTSANRLTAQERASVLAALTSALKHVSSLEVEGGVLAQAWMPDGEELRLHTKGLPFSLIGSGDLLALFRCLSCKFSFSTDLQKLPLMGSPGRVFSTGEAETSDNVQQCGVDIYLRNQEARACRIFSTIHLPLFNDVHRSRPVAVLEITQFKGSTNSYQAVFEWSRMCLQESGVYLPQQLETKTFEMRSHAMSIRFTRTYESAFGDLFTAQQEVQGRDSSTLRIEDAPDAVLPASKRLASEMAEEAGGDQAVPTHKQGEQDSSTDGEDEEMPDTSPRGGAQGPNQSSDTPYGKSMLSKQDLENHFAFSLSEAARKLGVSNTTVKRACRRYGIARWPRQEIMKAAAEREAAAKAAVPMETLAAFHVPPSTAPWGHVQGGSAAPAMVTGSCSLSQGQQLGASASHLTDPDLRRHLREGLPQGKPLGEDFASSAPARWHSLQSTLENRVPLQSHSRSLHPPFLGRGESSNVMSQQGDLQLSGSMETEAQGRGNTWQQGLEGGVMNLDSLSVLDRDQTDSLSNWPSQWCMDLDDESLTKS